MIEPDKAAVIANLENALKKSGLFSCVRHEWSFPEGKLLVDISCTIEEMSLDTLLEIKDLFAIIGRGFDRRILVLQSKSTDDAGGGEVSGKDEDQ